MKSHRSRIVAVFVGLLHWSVSSPPAFAIFHVAHISEVMTSYDGDPNIQFVEITMDALGQNLVSGTKLNVFDSAGEFIETALTVPSNVAGGAARPWLMGTAAFQAKTGIVVDFAFTDGVLPVDGGMICWGKPGDSPTPVSCPISGSPYVDCVAYGTYSGPTNGCIGTPTPLVPVGHSLRRVSATDDNANDFVCADPADPENNARNAAQMPATSPCVAPTTTTIVTTTTSATTSTTQPTVARCAQPVSSGSAPVASDCLYILNVAVGSQSCIPDACVCDPSGDGGVAATDALLCLSVAVGNPATLSCPCDGGGAADTMVTP